MTREVDGDSDGLGLRRLRNSMLVTGGVVLLVTVGVGVAVARLAPTRPGHHRSLFVAIIAVVIPAAILAGVGVIAWQRLARDESRRRLMRVDKPTRRRVLKALRKGLPVTAADRETALTFIHLYRRNRWQRWLYPGLAANFLILSISAHGLRRWFYLATAVLNLAVFPVYLRQRKRVLSREAELAPSDLPHEPGPAAGQD